MPSNTTSTGTSQPTIGDNSYVASSPTDYATLAYFPTSVTVTPNPVQVACGEDVCIIEALVLTEARFHWAETIANALHPGLEEFEEVGVIRIQNITDGRTTN